MVDITTISQIVATVSIVIGVIFTLVELRHLADPHYPVGFGVKI